MTPTAVEQTLTDALDLTRQARLLALGHARRDPGSTWVDAYTAIHRAESQLAAAGARDGDPDTHPARPARTCRQLLASAQARLATIAPGAGPVTLVLAHAYLSQAITDVDGREP